MDLKGRVPFVAIHVVVLIFVLIFSDPPRILLGIFAIYAISGPIVTLVTLRRLRLERKANTQFEDDTNLEDQDSDGG